MFALCNCIILTVNYIIFSEFSECLIDVAEPSTPLILGTSTLLKLFYPPKSDHVIRIRDKFTVRWACPGSTVKLQNIDTGNSSVFATCKVDSDSEMMFKSSEIKCRSQILTHLINTRGSCGNFQNGIFLNVNFVYGPGQKTRIYSVCYDEYFYTPIFTFHSLVRTLGVEDSDFSDADVRIFLGRDRVIFNEMRWVLALENQQQLINEQLNLPPSSSKYVNENNYLVPSFLVSAQNFYYEAQKNSTYRYANSAPQWKSIKEGNWPKIGKEIREYVRLNQRSLLVWTGLYGKCSLFSNQSIGEMLTPLYVSTFNNISRIPVASHFWSVVYDIQQNAGIVLITSNNPYAGLRDPQVFCDDISATTGWIVFSSKHNATLGYSFACSVSNFKNVARNAPQVYPSNILSFN